MATGDAGIPAPSSTCPGSRGFRAVFPRSKVPLPTRGLAGSGVSSTIRRFGPSVTGSSSMRTLAPHGARLRGFACSRPPRPRPWIRPLPSFLERPRGAPDRASSFETVSNDVVGPRDGASLRADTDPEDPEWFGMNSRLSTGRAREGKLPRREQRREAGTSLRRTSPTHWPMV